MAEVPLYPAESARVVRALADELERLVLQVAAAEYWPSRRRPVAYHVVRYVDRVVALCLDADGMHDWSELLFLQQFFTDVIDLRDEPRWIRETAASAEQDVLELLHAARRFDATMGTDHLESILAITGRIAQLTIEADGRIADGEGIAVERLLKGLRHYALTESA